MAKAIQMAMAMLMAMVVSCGGVEPQQDANGDADIDGNTDSDTDCEIPAECSAGDLLGCSPCEGRSTGLRACIPGCGWGRCQPPSEACNGWDDDCDGEIDEGCMSSDADADSDDDSDSDSDGDSDSGVIYPDSDQSGTWDAVWNEDECWVATVTPLTEGGMVIDRLPFGDRNVGLLLTFELPLFTPLEATLVLRGDFENTFCCGQDELTVLRIRGATFEDLPENTTCCGCTTPAFEPPVEFTGEEVLARVEPGNEEVTIDVTDLLPPTSELQLYIELADRAHSSGDAAGEIGLVHDLEAYLQL